MGGAAFGLARERAAKLRLIADNRICVPDRVVKRPGESVVVTVPRVAGVSLGALTAQRGYLSVGECVYVGIQVCGALGAMHEAGLSHGDVSPASVMMTRDGIVLIDTVTGASSHEHGTTGFSAPERRDGASPAGDVYSLGALLAACVAPSMRQGFMGWLDPMLDGEPRARPSARAVESGLARCADAVPVKIPDDSIVDELRTQAQEPLERTFLLRASRPWRLRRVGLRVTLASVATIGAVAAALYVIPWPQATVGEGNVAAEGLAPGENNGVDEALTGAAAASPSAGVGQGPSVPTATASNDDPERAARDLTTARFVALAAGDGEGLLAGILKGSELEDRIQAQANQLEAGTLRFEGVTVSIVGVEAIGATLMTDTDPTGGRGLGAGPGLQPGVPVDVHGSARATVRVTYDVAAHVVWRDGQQTRVSAHREVAELELVHVGATWMVERVLPQS